MNQFNEGEDADLDAAASPENTLCERFFSEDRSAFDYPWRASTVWCNPPYSRSLLGSFIQRAISQLKAHHCAKVIMLLPARTDTQWFKSLVEAGASIVFITGRLNFGGPNTNYYTSAPFPSVVVCLERGRGLATAYWRDRP